MADIQNYMGDIVIFDNGDEGIRVQIDAVNETIWMTQKSMADLFGVQRPAITKHLSNIFTDGELEEDSVSSILEHTAQDGKSYKVQHYNLDAIIAVGYRVNSKRATQFRIWATKTLREYLVKGYVLDDERFKKGQSLSYFKDLIERIREIRVSEKIFYQQIKDIYRLSVDYDKDDKGAIEFFAKIQNKLLWAVSQKTAAELIYYRANHSLPQMGLTSTETAGIVKAVDVGTGKNYLEEQELKDLKLIVEQYLAFAEAQAHNHIPMYMKDWEANLDIILTMNRKNILTTKGRISMELAKKKARTEYLQYKAEQRESEKLQSIKELDEDLKRLKT